MNVNQIKRIGAGLLVCTLVCFGCGDKDDTGPVNQPASLTLTVDVSKTHQTITGFGAASRMWGTQFLKPAEAKKAFGLGANELGLSMFRVRIASNSAEWPAILDAIKEAQKYGAAIIASPWSPPAALKSNNSDIGGHLLPENYAAFKDHINGYINFMQTNGVTIRAVSVQNEPDIQVSYESCDWSVTEMGNFIRSYGDQIMGADLMAPESFNFNSSYTNDLLFDQTIAQNLDIVAGHIYGGGLGDFLQAEQKGKEIWMTEYLLNLNYRNAGDWSAASESTKWNESVEMLKTMHAAMSHNWNAYIWWYLQRFYSLIGDGEEGTTNGEVLKRGYAFSHFSKFVRPGFVRVDLTPSKTSSLLSTAYVGDGKVVCVLVNPTDQAVLNVHIAASSKAMATTYTSTVNITMDEKQLDSENGDFVVQVPAKTVVTLVAQ